MNSHKEHPIQIRMGKCKAPGGFLVHITCTYNLLFIYETYETLAFFKDNLFLKVAMRESVNSAIQARFWSQKLPEK